MKEIILKRDGIDTYTSLEITEYNELKIQMRIDERGMHETFTLEEIDDLQEAISIMKDRLQRNLSNKADNFNCEIVPAPDFSLIAELTGGKLLIESVKNDSDNVVIKGKIQKNDTPTEQKDAQNVSNNEQIVEEKSTYGGEIADFPIEVVEKMLENQVLQGNPRDVSVFEKYKCSGIYGFDWGNTNDGKEFWNDVINNKNFALFFERYPIKMTARYTQQEHLERLMNFKIPFVRFSDKKICTITEIDNLKSYPIKVSSGEQYSYNGFFENFGNFDGSEFYID